MGKNVKGCWQPCPIDYLYNFEAKYGLLEPNLKPSQTFTLK